MRRIYIRQTSIWRYSSAFLLCIKFEEFSCELVVKTCEGRCCKMFTLCVDEVHLLCIYVYLNSCGIEPKSHCSLGQC
jgi:hypothetical protein